jgi:hypothetical protein
MPLFKQHLSLQSDPEFQVCYRLTLSLNRPYSLTQTCNNMYCSRSFSIFLLGCNCSYTKDRRGLCGSSEGRISASLLDHIRKTPPSLPSSPPRGIAVEKRYDENSIQKHSIPHVTVRSLAATSPLGANGQAPVHLKAKS